MSLILPSFYLAPVSYYCALYRAEEAKVEVYDHYCKQTCRNRCCIDSPNGPLILSIPVEKTFGHILLRDVRISDHGNWRHQHWNALVSSYRQTPFFEFYAEDFHPFYEKKWTYLADFNEELMHLVCNLLDIATPFSRTTEYTPSSSIVDYGVKTYYQIFSSKHGFLPDLSIVDLLFNMGPEGIFYL